MTDEAKPKNDLELDWDDALSDWEKGLDASHAHVPAEKPPSQPGADPLAAVLPIEGAELSAEEIESSVEQVDEGTGSWSTPPAPMAPEKGATPAKALDLDFDDDDLLSGLVAEGGPIAETSAAIPSKEALPKFGLDDPQVLELTHRKKKSSATHQAVREPVQPEDLPLLEEEDSELPTSQLGADVAAEVAETTGLDALDELLEMASTPPPKKAAPPPPPPSGRLGPPSGEKKADLGKTEPGAQRPRSKSQPMVKTLLRKSEPRVLTEEELKADDATSDPGVARSPAFGEPRMSDPGASKLPPRAADHRSSELGKSGQTFVPKPPASLGKPGGILGKSAQDLAAAKAKSGETKLPLSGEAKLPASAETKLPASETAKAPPSDTTRPPPAPGFDGLESLDLALSELEKETPERTPSVRPPSSSSARPPSSASVKPPSADNVPTTIDESPVFDSAEVYADATVPEAAALIAPSSEERYPPHDSSEERSSISITDESIDALAPPPSTVVAAPDSGAPPIEKPDRGAATAMRTVRSRKPRKESFRLVGNSHETLEARRELLSKLSEGASGSAKARLLVACAELTEQLGEGEEAVSLYEAARNADPRDVVALRALRRDATGKGDFRAVAQLLEAEAGLALSVKDRATAYTALAEVSLERLGDAPAAERAARTALGLGGGTVAAALVLAQACLAQDRVVEAHIALEKAADAWQDPVGKAVLRVEVARQAETSGTTARARPHYAAAAEADATAIEALLGVARCARAAGDHDAAAGALAGIAFALGDGPLAEAFSRQAARILHRLANRPAEAVSVLDKARSPLALRARADAAQAAGDTASLATSLEALAAASGGTERALALVRLAEARADANDLDGAEAALRDASLADGSLSTIRVVRELLARRGGDSSRLASAVEGRAGTASALVAAAKVALDPNALGRERELLSRAVTEGEAPVTADVLTLDAAATADDLDEVKAGLRRKAARAVPALRSAPLVALATFSSGEARIETLREARNEAPQDRIARHALATATEATLPAFAAELWLEESGAAHDDHAAFSALHAARLLKRANEDVRPAFRRAFEAKPTYLPSAWALEVSSRIAGDLEQLAVLNERLAEEMADPVERAGRLVRAGLLRAEHDPSSAQVLLMRAKELAPDDAILTDLLLRLGNGIDPRSRAELHLAGTKNAPAELARVGLVRAATLLEQASEHARAADLYRRAVALDVGTYLSQRGAERAELGAGEGARVTERRFQALRDAATDVQRIRALERLAELDFTHRNDPASGVMSLQSILEIAPSHLPSLRMLELYFMEQARDEDLLTIEERLAMHLGSPKDAAAHARLAARLRLREAKAEGNAADAFLLEVAHRADLDLWLARRVAAAAEARGERTTLGATLTRMAELLESPTEKASAALRASEVVARAAGNVEAADVLAPFAKEAAAHPTANEELGRLEEAAGRPAQAADAYELAARAARVPRRAAELFYRAAKIRADVLNEPERALTTFEEVAAVDPTYLDTYARLETTLREKGELSRLARWMDARVNAGGSVAQLVELHSSLGELREQLGDRSGAKDALRSALALEPEHPVALKRLADLCIADEDWRNAAEALIRIARLRKTREELRWVFFTLGDIYDKRMPDSQRAEAAFKRVLKVEPADVETMERLANLFERENNLAAAADMLRQLVATEVDPDKNRGYRLQLASALERGGDARQAERVLEDTRRASPTDLAVLRAFAEFYRGQNAQSALAMHLNRAVNDYRHAIENDPLDDAAWPGLVEVLQWRGRKDAARACASAGASLGLVDVHLARLLDPDGGIPGASAAGLDDSLDDLIAPPQLSGSVRAVMRLSWEAFDKVLPFDLRGIRAEKLTPREGPLRNAINVVSRWINTEVQVYATEAATRVCVPVSSSPLAVLVSRDLIAATPERDWIFLLARAAKVARGNFTVAARSDGSQFAIAMHGLVRFYDTEHSPAGFDAGELDNAAKRIGKQISRRARDELRPLLVEMLATSGFDPAAMGRLSLELGSRAAVIASGSLPAAMSALLRLSGVDPMRASQANAKIMAVRSVPEAAALVRFALSDAHFEARHRAGADRL